MGATGEQWRATAVPLAAAGLQPPKRARHARHLATERHYGLSRGPTSATRVDAGAEHGLAKGGEAEQREEQRVARAAEG